MLEILEKWNRWGTNSLDSGIPRQVLMKIQCYLHTKEIIALTGPRRSGKSTILYQLMDILENEGIQQKAMLHINFEEPKLLPFLNLEALDTLYESYREHIYPQGKAYLFLDEIQNIPEWERWVRARNKTENIKIFLTGSSAKLMSREIATLLTGRHLTFEIMPLNFTEFLKFQQIAFPEHKRPISPPASVKKGLNEYQKWGGFPAVTLADSLQYKMDLLSEYFDDILYKDIVLRHNIRDMMLLRHIAVHLLTQTGSLISFQRVGNMFQVSSDSAISYCHYIQECYMIELLPFYSLKTSIRQRHPQKVYALDLGLRNTVSLTHSADEGRLIETLAYQALRKQFRQNIFYWQGKGEIDFVIREGNRITQLWQIVAEHLDDDRVRSRELRSFEEAKKAFPEAEMFLVTKMLPAKTVDLPVKIVPLWLLLTGQFFQ